VLIRITILIQELFDEFYHYIVAVTMVRILWDQRLWRRFPLVERSCLCMFWVMHTTVDCVDCALFNAVPNIYLHNWKAWLMQQAASGRAAATVCPRPSPPPVGAEAHCDAEQTAT